MAKLTDLIQRATHPQAAPLGFASMRAKPAPTLITVALISANWKAAAADAVAAGAQAVLLSGSPSEADVKAAAEAAGDSPCGVIADANLDALREAGVDFVVLGGEASASALQTEHLTFLLNVSEDISDIQLRTVEPLPVDALVLDAPPGPFTIGRQMELQRITGLARKPMLLSPAAGVSRDDLLSLRDSGVLLLSVDMSASDAAKTLTELAKLVEALPARRSRQRGEKGEVTLPTPSQGHGHEEHDHEDEE